MIGEQEITVTYKITTDSYMAMFSTLYKDSPRAKKTNKAAKWNVIAALLGAGFVTIAFYLQSAGYVAAIFPDQTTQNIIWFTSVFAFGIVAGLLLFLAVYYPANLSYMIKLSESFEERNLTNTTTLSPEGLECRNEWGTFYTLWKGVERIYEAPETIVIVIFPDQGIPIPFSAFQNEDDRKKFIAYANDRIAAAKIWQ